MDELTSIHLTIYNPKMVGQEAKKLDPKSWSTLHRNIRDLIESGGGEVIGIWLSAINAPQQSLIIKAELPTEYVDVIRDAISNRVSIVPIPTSWIAGEETFFI